MKKRLLYISFVICLISCENKNTSIPKLNNLLLHYDSLENVDSKYYEPHLLIYDSLLAGLKEAEYDTIKANIYRRRGYIFFRQLRLKESIEAQINGLELSYELGDTIGYWSTYANIGSTYHSFKMYQKALEYYEPTFRHNSRKKFQMGIALNAYNISEVHLNLGNKDSALYFARIALKAKRNVPTKHRPYSTDSLDYLLNFMSVLEENNEIDSLSHYLPILLTWSHNEENMENRMSAFSFLNRYYTWVDLGKAKIYYDSVQSNMHKLVMSDTRQLILENNVKYLTQIGQADSALRYMLALQNFKDSSYTQENFRTLANTTELFKNLNDADKKNLQLDNARKNGLLWFLGLGLLAFLVLGLFFYRNYRQKQMLTQQKLQLKENEISQILKSKELETFDAALRGQDEERNRIAQELHDGLASTLVVAKTNFDTLKLNIQEIEAKNKKSLEQISEILAQATDEVRKISHDLYAGSVVNFGIETALHQIADAIGQANPIQVSFTSKNVPKQLSQDVQINLYRIAQELLSNSLKYARASTIYLQLIGHAEDSFSFSYEDNGQGFDMRQSKEGIGIKNILTRVEKIGGVCRFESQPGEGMSFHVDIPLKTKPIL